MTEAGTTAGRQCAEAVHHAWTVATGEWLDERTVEEIQVHSLTVQAVSDIARLGRYAVEAQTGPLVDMAGMETDPEILLPVVCKLLLRECLVAMRGGSMIYGHAIGWVTLVASAADNDTYWSIPTRMLPYDGVEQLRRYEMLGDWDAAAGALAPWAFAAGLTPDEARRGVPDRETLRTLAALRGYRLPDTEVFG